MRHLKPSTKRASIEKCTEAGIGDDIVGHLGRSRSLKKIGLTRSSALFFSSRSISFAPLPDRYPTCKPEGGSFLGETITWRMDL